MTLETLKRSLYLSPKTSKQFPPKSRRLTLSLRSLNSDPNLSQIDGPRFLLLFLNRRVFGADRLGCEWNHARCPSFLFWMACVLGLQGGWWYRHPFKDKAVDGRSFVVDDVLWMCSWDPVLCSADGDLKLGEPQCLPWGVGEWWPRVTFSLYCSESRSYESRSCSCRSSNYSREPLNCLIVSYPPFCRLSNYSSELNRCLILFSAHVSRLSNNSIEPLSNYSNELSRCLKLLNTRLIFTLCISEYASMKFTTFVWSVGVNFLNSCI